MNPFDPGYYISEDLRAFTFARVGINCRVARNCTIIGLENITLGDNVRIDGFTTLIAASGKLKIGSNVHIGSGCFIGARGGVELRDFSSLSHGAKIFSAIDDYSGRAMSNATLPPEALRVHAAPVVIGRYVPVGANSLVLPGVEIGEGAAVNAMSLVAQSLKAWTIHGGNPARELAERSRNLLAVEQRLAASDD